MDLEFQKFSQFRRGILVDLLCDAYSFEPRYEQDWKVEWTKADDFFFDHLSIADSCGFISTLNYQPIGFICWDPRNASVGVEIGHNCILTAYKRQGFGKKQLQEAIARIKRISTPQVTTDEQLTPAQKNYQSVGFQFKQKRTNPWNAAYAGMLIDYELTL